MKYAKKYRREYTKFVVNVCKCYNPRCITSTERNLDQIFNLVDKDNKVYRCFYCESALEKEKFIY